MMPPEPPGGLPERESLALQGVRVGDLSDSVAGQFAARLMADQGAEVLLVEPPEGSALRRRGPFAAAPPAGAAESLLFRHLSSGKAIRSGGGGPVDGLACAWPEPGELDVVITSDRSTRRRATATFPEAVVATVNDFADGGPYSQWVGSELIHQALSGSMYYNGRYSDRPLHGAGHRASYGAGFLLYTRILAELLARLKGRPTEQVVDLSVHESAAVMEQNFSTQWAYSHTVPLRGEWNRPKGRVRCRDGWVVFFAMHQRQRELFRAFGAEDAAEDPRFAEWPDFVRNISEACQLFTARSRERTQQQIMDAALRDRLVLSPVRQLGDLYQEEHLRVRGYWRRTSDGSGAGTLLGPVWRMPERDTNPQGTGDSSAEPVGAERVSETGDHGASSEPLPGWATEDEHIGPLQGVRVIDLTSAWSGPMATRVLAALGAEVIKLEGPNRMDGWRGPRTSPTHLESYPGCVPGAHPFNRNAWFNTQNPGKKSVAIDLKQQRGTTLALQLIARSDLVIANFSPGTLDRLGLGLAEAEVVNATVSVVEMSGYGDTGPLRNHRGLGQTMEAMSGITSLIGYGTDGEPLGSGSAYLDPMGGLAGAAAAVTALVHSHRTQRAHRAELPQREAAMHWIGEKILDAVDNQVSYRPAGNDVADAFPHDAFPAAGPDQWIAVAVLDAEQWVALCRMCGWDTWRRDRALRTLVGRMAIRAEITAALTAVTQVRDKAELARDLQFAGVPAAPVQDGRDLYLDPHLRARGWFTALHHDEVGDCDYPGVPVQVHGSLVRPLRAAPRFAQDTDDVLGSLLELDAHTIDELVAAGVVVRAEPASRTDPAPGPATVAEPTLPPTMSISERLS